MIPAEKMPYSIPIRMRDGNPMTYDSGDYPESQRQALQAADWDGFSARREASLAEGRLRGIGLSNYVELTGRGPFESVTVRIGPSGRILSQPGRHPRDRERRLRWRKSWRTSCTLTLIG